MIGRWIQARLAAFERKTGESTDYVREMLEHSPAGFWRFALFLPLAAHYRALPKAAYHVARIVAMQHEDCGPCLQTVVSLAARDRVPNAILQAALDKNWAGLPPELREVASYAQAVVARNASLESDRQQLITRLGEKAMTELALAIAAARVFPTVKRAMGHGQSCALVRIEVPDHVA